MSAQPLISCRNISVKYRIRYHKVDTFKESFVHAGRNLWRCVATGFRAAKRENYSKDFCALKNVSFDAWPGDFIGLIGRNGAGKSTLLRQLAKIEIPDEGQIDLRGTIGTLLNLTAGFKNDLSGMENIYLRGAVLGFQKDQIDQLLPKLLDFCELGEFIYAPLKTYSAGMRARLGFSIAIYVNPDILLLDEVIGVGDEKFKRKAGNIFDHLGGNKVAVLATHGLGMIENYCNKALWLEEGRVNQFGPAKDIVEEYRDYMAQ